MRTPFVVAASLLLVACATRSAEEKTLPETPPPEAPEVHAVSDAEITRALASAERRIDEYAALTAYGESGAVRRRRDLRRGLEEFADENVGALLARARDANDPTRRQAVLSLGFARDRRATEVVTAALGETSNPALQNAAGFALASIGDPNTQIPPLVAAARSPDADVRVNALLAIRRVLEVRGAFANYVDAGSRGELGNLLMETLADPDAGVRANAAAVAGALNEPRAVPGLLPLLKDEDLTVRSRAATALGDLGDRSVADALVDAIGTTPRGPARDAVIEALRTLLERHHVEVPTRLADSEETWAAFTQRAFDDLDRRPMR